MSARRPVEELTALDNAVAESFFGTLKTELIYQVEMRGMETTKVEVFEFIEIWRPPLRYNRQKIHESLTYMTPDEYGIKLNQHQKVA